MARYGDGQGDAGRIDSAAAMAMAIYIDFCVDTIIASIGEICLFSHILVSVPTTF